MIKLFFFSTLIFSGILISGCTSNAGDLFTQALNEDLEIVNEDDVSNELINDAPVRKVAISGYGKVLTTEAYLPLYVNSQDTSLGSSCYDECAIAWPPLLINSADEVAGDYSFIERTDGNLQVTRNGKPLYSYTPDSNRKVTGDGNQGIWSVVILEEELVEEVEE